MHVKFIYNGIECSGAEFISIFQEKFRSVEAATYSLNIARYHSFIVMYGRVGKLVHIHNGERFFYVEDTCTKWFYYIKNNSYYFYKIL